MRTYLLHPDRDFDFKRDLRANATSLTQDLELETLIAAMAAGDEFLADIARRVILADEPTKPQEIGFRHDVLLDCMSKEAAVREIYDLAVETLEAERNIHLGIWRDSPESVLNRAVNVMAMFVDMLKRLRSLVDKYAPEFRSEGFRQMFGVLSRELGDDYFATIEGHLKRLKFNGGVLISAELGEGNKGANYTLRAPPPRPNWLQRIIDFVMRRKPDCYTFQLHPRDEQGFQALSRLRDRGLSIAAIVMAESVDHVLSFFRTLRAELGFYLGALNLRHRLEELGCRSCMPDARPEDTFRFDCTSLYDICLALHLGKSISGNTVRSGAKQLFVVTGANQGGKSTFLRSVGQAQLMLQAGLFVGAESLSANAVSGVFTHYRREEDAGMSSGKFDEELARMSGLVDEIDPHALVLFNESFASTNEREGSEIASQIVGSLLKHGNKVFFVTHMFELADGLRKANPAPAMFLRAERKDDGERSYKLLEGDALATSFGEDLYLKIFKAETVSKPDARQKEVS